MGSRVSGAHGDDLAVGCYESRGGMVRLRWDFILKVFPNLSNAMILSTAAADRQGMQKR